MRKLTPRLAVTIVYNGLHHLQHLNFTEFMASNFDYWAVVDGLSGNKGSTSGCNLLKLPASSTDGTVEYMKEVSAKHPNVLFYSQNTPFQSKDQQVNRAIQILRSKVRTGLLWQVDVDEKWTEENLIEAEKKLASSHFKQAAFQFNHYVGNNLMAVGEWGSSYVNRLFKWSGQNFVTHEPAVMHHRVRTMPIEGLRFDHYSYYFRQDVAFKDKYYKGYAGVLNNWDLLQTATKFPLPVSVLLPKECYMSTSNSKIIKI